MTERRRSDAASFRAARDLLLRHRADYDAARAGFSWPELDEFNWALDWFDVIATEHPDRTALRIVTAPAGAPASDTASDRTSEASDIERGTRVSYAEMAARLGPRLLVAAMAPPATAELALGLVRDPQLGLLVVVGLGIFGFAFAVISSLHSYLILA